MKKIVIGLFLLSCYLHAQNFYIGTLYNNAQIETKKNDNTESTNNSVFYGLNFGYITEYKDRIEWLIMQDPDATNQYVSDVSYKFTTTFGESLPYGKIGVSAVVLDSKVETTTGVVGIGIINPITEYLEIEFATDYKSYYFEQTDADAQMISLYAQINIKF